MNSSGSIKRKAATRTVWMRSSVQRCVLLFYAAEKKEVKCLSLSWYLFEIQNTWKFASVTAALHSGRIVACLHAHIWITHDTLHWMDNNKIPEPFHSHILILSRHRLWIDAGVWPIPIGIYLCWRCFNDIHFFFIRLLRSADIFFSLLQRKMRTIPCYYYFSFSAVARWSRQPYLNLL